MVFCMFRIVLLCGVCVCPIFWQHKHCTGTFVKAIEHSVCVCVCVCVCENEEKGERERVKLRHAGVLSEVKCKPGKVKGHLSVQL